MRKPTGPVDTRTDELSNKIGSLPKLAHLTQVVCL
jgi:hypothetical protein